MPLPLISILMTAYNYGAFIEEAVDSVLSQNYPPDRMEVVVVDDGSSDDTAYRLTKYGPRIRYLQKPNGGQASALNLGFTLCTGEIISLIDADDVFFPEKLSRVAEAFEDPELGMFYHPFLEFDVETGVRRQSTFPLVTGSLFREPEKFLWYGGPGTCISIRRKFLDPLLPIPEEIRMLADGYIGGLVPFIAPIRATADCLAGYRLHGKNAYYATESQMPPDVREKRLRMFKIEFEAMCRWLTANGFTQSQPPVKWFFQRGLHFMETQQFALSAPGRLRFFRHLARYNLAYGPYMTPRLRAINWFNAFASLLAGYHNFHRLDQWRLAAVRRIKRQPASVPAPRH